MISKNQAHRHEAVLNEPCEHCLAAEKPLVELPGGYYVSEEDTSAFWVDFAAYGVLLLTLLSLFAVAIVTAR